MMPVSPLNWLQYTEGIRGNGAFVHLIRIERGAVEVKPAANQAVILAGLLTGRNIVAEHRDDLITQTADILPPWDTAESADAGRHISPK